MTTANPTRFVISMIVLLSASGFASPQTKKTGVTLSSVLSREHVLSLVPWAVHEKGLLCVISERTVTLDHETGPVRVMTIYSHDASLLTKVFELQSLDAYVSAYPLGESESRLFMASTGGSAYHFRVFEYRDGKVHQVLEASSKGMPEIIIDPNERELVIVTHMEFADGEWKRTADSSADVYKWNGKAYDKLGTVPWAKRLQCLSRESCAALK
jgi:hypothetical protein